MANVQKNHSRLEGREQRPSQTQNSWSSAARAQPRTGGWQESLMVSAILCLTLAFAAGCADLGRGLTKLTFSPGADPETTVNWVIELDPLDAPAKRTLFLTVRNISGEDDIDI